MHINHYAPVNRSGGHPCSVMILLIDKNHMVTPLHSPLGSAGAWLPLEVSNGSDALVSLGVLNEAIITCGHVVLL